MQTIKKYANRKLYHLDRKRYITLDGIAELIQAGEQVQVLDNETGEDISASILAQVALQARAANGWPPTQLLTGLIRTGGNTIVEMQRSVWMTLGGPEMIDAEIVRRLERLYQSALITEEELRRLSRLLLQSETPAQPSGSLIEGLPTRQDVVRLREQVNALSAMVEQLMENQQRHR